MAKVEIYPKTAVKLILKKIALGGIFILCLGIFVQFGLKH